MPSVREKYTCIYLGSFVPNTVLQSWLPFSSFLFVHGIPKSFGCVSTIYSEKRMEVSETQRDSNPLEMFTFFLLFSTVGWSRVGAFSSWRDLVSDFSCVLLLLLTHRKRQSGGVGGFFVSFRSVLFFELGFQVF